MPNQKDSKEKILRPFKGRGMGGSSPAPAPAPRALPVETNKKAPRALLVDPNKKAPRALLVDPNKKAPKAEKVGGQTLSDEEIEKYHKDLNRFKQRMFELEQKKKKEAIEFYKSLQT